MPAIQNKLQLAKLHTSILLLFHPPFYYLEPDLMSSFKIALKNIKPSQATAIDQLFASYGY